MPTEATEGPQEPLKRLGRPKGSVNKVKASNDLTADLASKITKQVIDLNKVPASQWSFEPDNLKVKLASEHVKDGLDSVIKTHVIVGVSELPNGMASIITNIGVQQPFILVTVEPYADVVARLFPGVK